MKSWLRHTFIPSQQNDYTPDVFQKTSMLLMTLLVVLTFTIANLQTLVWISSDWLVSTILPAVIVNLTNDERSADGLPQLRRNTTLDEAATLKAQHMAAESYFAHYSPAGVTPWHWFDEAGYTFAHAGENLAIHFTDSGEVVEAWMDSPSHRENIVSGNFTEIGVGTARGRFEGYDTIFVVQLFGTPAVSPRGPLAEANTAEPALAAAPQVEPAPATNVLAEQIELPPAELAIETAAVDTAVATPVADTNTELEASAVSDLVPVSTPDASTASKTRLAPTPTTTLVVQEDQTVSVYTDTIASSSGLVPAPVVPPTVADSTWSDRLLALVVQPQLFLQFTYAFIGLFVVVSLVLSIVIEIRQQRPWQIAYGAALLVLMTGLYYAHTSITGGALIV